MGAYFVEVKLVATWLYTKKNHMAEIFHHSREICFSVITGSKLLYSGIISHIQVIVLTVILLGKARSCK